MKKYWRIFGALFLAFALGGCGGKADAPEQEEPEPVEAKKPKEPEQAEAAKTSREAVYLGVENYGAEKTNKERKDDFRYRFEVEGREKILSIDGGALDAQGNCAYPIQNVLKEGYSYEITVSDDVVTAAREIAADAEASYEPPVGSEPGVKTLKNFLSTALAPVGTALYIYGGGWDWQDVGASIQARTIGVSSDWVRFFDAQDENFTYRDKDGNEANRDDATSYYPYGGYNEYYYAGLDCSGYLGWALYNTFESESGKEGYVMPAAQMAKYLADAGWGHWTHEVGGGSADMKPGDIMSMDGHVWISLGTCADGSVVIVHSAPTDSHSSQPGGGVQIGAIGGDESCEAYRLADAYMTKYYPAWRSRYDTALKKREEYFSFTNDAAGHFSWEVGDENAPMADPEGMQRMSPTEVLTELFGVAPDGL